MSQLKPDFEKTAKRFEAWWHCDLIDRAVVDLNVKPSRPPRTPDKQHESLRDRWLDVEWNVDRQIDALEARSWPGDSLPRVQANVGPDLTSALWDVELEFSEHSSWAVHGVDDLDGLEGYVDRPANFDNLYWKTVEAIMRRAIELQDGRYLVELPDLHGAYDMLVALRGPENLCMDLLDDPDLVRRAALSASKTFNQAFCRAYGILKDAGLGSISWIPMYHDGPAYIPSCDFWCLVSGAAAREHCLPALLEEMRPLERSIFHLDGPQALRHLDLLLDIPHLNAVQWVYGAGNGPATRWIHVYRRCLEAGKSVHVQCVSADDGLAVVREIGQKGVFLSVPDPFPTTADAEAYLAEIARG